MKNRELRINTFEGGLDLDTDIKNISSQKLRSSKNIDITSEGDVSVVKDLNGESIKFLFESTENREVYTLGSINANFYVEPTKTNKDAIIVFYIYRDFVLNTSNFIVKALFTEDNSQQVILSESISDSDFNLLSDSSIDVQKIGKFEYDVLYFVDNRRQPRKIDCITYLTNTNVMTLTFNSEVDGDGYKQINLNLNSSSLPQQSTRVYVYAYQTGGSLDYVPLNPLTDSKKYLDVNYSGSSVIFFKIYPEDYSDYTFQIVYHKEGSEYYRNFTIGNPFQVNIKVGVVNEFIVGIKDPEDVPASGNVDSWEFLYDGLSFLGYIDTPTVEIGVTQVYLSEIVDPGNVVPDGYYQRGDLSNTFFRVESGVITEQSVNNGEVVWSCVPASINSDVRAAANNIDEGFFNRLSSINIDVPQTINVDGVDFTFIETVAKVFDPGQKKSLSSNFTYTLERPDDLSVVSYYSSEEIEIEAFLIDYNRDINTYSITGRITLSSELSQDISATMRVNTTLLPYYSGYAPIYITVDIPAGELNGSGTVYDTVEPNESVNFGPSGMVNFVYGGPETITMINQII